MADPVGPRRVCTRLAGILDATGLTNDCHLDLSRENQVVLDFLGDIPGQIGRLNVVHVSRIDHYADFAAGLDAAEVDQSAMHLRLALSSLRGEDLPSTIHHVEHFMESATGDHHESAEQILEDLTYGDLHDADERLALLLGEDAASDQHDEATGQNDAHDDDEIEGAHGEADAHEADATDEAEMHYEADAHDEADEHEADAHDEHEADEHEADAHESEDEATKE